jgi:glycerate kinase
VRGVPRLLAAPDKFRGTASAGEIADAIVAAAQRAGWTAARLPISDGGEGLLDCFGGANRVTTVAGPSGPPVAAPWRLDGTRAVIEMAAASGIALTGGANDPMTADTRGTGELVAAAVAAGARDVLVGAGGSAGTDGGLGAVEVLRDHRPLDGSRGARVVVATDVRTLFVDAAAVFAPQKGADAEQVRALTDRLTHLAARYLSEFGVDVRPVPGGGAAGGLAGGLAALGAAIRPGFDVVAAQLDLASAVRAADLVITGEGRLDATSLQGKATGSLAGLAAGLGVPVVVVAGQVEPGLEPPFPVLDLTRTFGVDRARTDTVACVRAAVTDLLLAGSG